MQIALEQNGGFWLLKVGYDERFSHASPGQLLLRDTIRYAAQAGLASYEFLGTAEAWTEMWTKEQHRYLAARVYPYTPRGLAALLVDLGRAKLRQWRSR